MGQISFLLPDPLPADVRRCLDRAALATLAGGYDQSLVPARVRVDGRKLTATRDVSESVFLLTPWPADGLGAPATLTATLRERPEPYLLPLELARGKVNQVRLYAAEWQQAGLALGAADEAALSGLVRAFGRAAVAADQPDAGPAAARVLADAHRLGDKLTADFAALLMAHRRADPPAAATAVGARVYRPLGPAEKAAYLAAFDAVRVVPDWSRIEPTEARTRWDELDAVVDWAAAAGLDVSVGPLVDLGLGPFPDWLGQWAGDLPSLAAFMCDFVETVVSRYRGKVGVWQVFAGFNHADALGLVEDDRLRLAARLLEAARQAAPEAKLVIGLSQAWGDYLAGDDLTYSPLVFADTLLRGGLDAGAGPGGAEVAGVELELLCGDGPRASLPRTVLDSYRVLDLFALLNVPLELTVAAPTGPGAPPGPPHWADGTLGLAVSVTQVHRAFWDCWSAADPCRVPGTNLWDGDRPAGDRLAALAALRQRAAPPKD